MLSPIEHFYFLLVFVGFFSSTDGRSHRVASRKETGAEFRDVNAVCESFGGISDLREMILQSMAEYQANVRRRSPFSAQKTDLNWRFLLIWYHTNIWHHIPDIHLILRNIINSLLYPIGSMVLLYMVTWIPSISPLYVSIYTSTMDPMGI